MQLKLKETNVTTKQKRLKKSQLVEGRPVGYLEA